MRSDMDKVIVERPRRGGDSYRSVRRRNGRGEELPTHQSMKKAHRVRKELNENLKPLERFLNARVGHLWDKVYAELNEHVKVSNAVQAHVRQHLPGMVEMHPLVNEYGQMCAKGWRGLTPLRVGDLYVDPKDGILKKVKKVVAVVFDPGMQEYVVYRVRTHGPYTSGIDYPRKYYLCKPTLALAKNLPSHVKVAFRFRAGTHQEAWKVFNAEMDRAYDHYRTEYV